MKNATGRLVRALTDKLTQLVFPPIYDGSACTFAGQPLFERVAMFDMTDLAAALNELLIFKKRVAIIVMTQETQSAQALGNVMTLTFHESFAIILTDQSYKNRQAALFGDDATPGVLLIADILVNGLFGVIAPGCFSVPAGGDVMAIVGKERENEVGRIGWRQDVILSGGMLKTDMPRGLAIKIA